MDGFVLPVQPCRNPKIAPLRHRIESIHHQRQQNLFNLSSVARDQRKFRIEFRLNLKQPADGDPTARSYLVARVGGAGVDPLVLIRRFDREDDVSARRALVIGLGAPPKLAVYAFACLAALPAGLTHYGTTPAPMFFAQGYVSFGTWWRIGFLTSLATLLIWGTVGFAWWRFLGIW